MTDSEIWTTERSRNKKMAKLEKALEVIWLNFLYYMQQYNCHRHCFLFRSQAWPLSDFSEHCPHFFPVLHLQDSTKSICMTPLNPFENVKIEWIPGVISEYHSSWLRWTTLAWLKGELSGPESAGSSSNKNAQPLRCLGHMSGLL